MGQHSRAAAYAVLTLAAACQTPLRDIDEIYYRGPGPRVLCAASIDRAVGEDAAAIAAALDRARDADQVLQLFGHRPGEMSDLDQIEAIAAGASARGLASVTYAELATQPPATGGLALSFDDDDVEAWAGLADRLDRYQVKVTFFVTRYHLMATEHRAILAELVSRGHDVEAHGVNHLRGPELVDRRGLDAYVADEVVPSLEALRRDGFPARVFAYPYGARTRAIDAAVLDHVDLVRSVSYARDGLLVTDPCPE